MFEHNFVIFWCFRIFRPLQKPIILTIWLVYCINFHWSSQKSLIIMVFPKIHNIDEIWSVSWQFPMVYENMSARTVRGIYYSSYPAHEFALVPFSKGEGDSIDFDRQWPRFSTLRQHTPGFTLKLTLTHRIWSILCFFLCFFYVFFMFFLCFFYVFAISDGCFYMSDVSW